MLSIKEKEVLKEKVYNLLWEVGMKVENEEIASRLLKDGCKEGASGRIRIPRERIDEVIAYQKKTQKQDEDDQTLHPKCGIDWAHSIIWRRQKDIMRKRLEKEFLMSAFDCGPTKYYDYKEKKVKPVDTKIFIEMMKLAQSTPEIGYISTWYRQDVHEKIERIDSLILGLKWTDKVDGIESIYPEQIKYLKEIGEIISDTPENTPYLAGSQCMTSPLILERRSAQEMVERAKRGIKRYHIASMVTIGINTPVTLAGAIVLGASEILGGMVAAFSQDREADLSGRMISSVVDMKNGNVTYTGPEPTMVNIGVKELFDECFGGHLWVEVFLSPCAKRPGLQAVYENFYGAWRYSKLVCRNFRIERDCFANARNDKNEGDIPYPGMGTLDNGGMGSPTQFMLDMEIRKSEFALKDKIIIDEETLPFEEMCEKVREGKDFLDSEHTMGHFRSLWTSRLFLTDEPKDGAWEGNEKSILDKCDELWRENTKDYKPPQWTEDKIKALGKLLTRAHKELI